MRPHAGPGGLLVVPGQAEAVDQGKDDIANDREVFFINAAMQFFLWCNCNFLAQFFLVVYLFFIKIKSTNTFEYRLKYNFFTSHFPDQMI